MAKQLTPIEAKLTLDASGVQTGASQATASVGAMTKALVGSKLITGAMGAAVSVAGAAIKGVTSVVKQSVSAYADYEQQVGGIEALFGANGDTLEEYAARVGKSTADATAEYDQLMEAQNTVMQNANDAWINQGMSANEYMQQVTGFAASLKQSTADSTEAADVANMAMSDMADNANKFGTDIGSIQNAYQGFAKQNYTMLDNLKLGYGGTKEEMQRLLTEAEKVTGIHYDINQLDDVYNAIHVIQGELNITGTTASEAMGTISGSASALSAAWQNTLVALGSGEGIDTAIQNLVTAFSTFADNILPVIQTVLESAGTAIAELAPKVAEMLPGLVEAVLPNILSALTSLVTSIATMLGDQSIIDSIVQAGVTLFSALLDNAPAILTALGTGIVNLIKGIGTAIGEQFPEVEQAFTDLFGDIDLKATAEGIFNDVKTGLETAWTTVTTWLDGIDLGSILEDVFTFTLDLLSIGKGIFEDFKTGLDTAWQSVKKWFNEIDISGFISGAFSGVKNFFSGLFGGGNEEETTTAVTTTGQEAAPTDSTVAMPTGVMTIDTAALNPVSQEVIDSWKALADAINAVNAAITGGSAEGGEGEAGAAGASAAAGAQSAEGGEEGAAAGLLGAFTTIKDTMEVLVDSTKNLATAFTETLTGAINLLVPLMGEAKGDSDDDLEADEGTLSGSLVGISKAFKAIVGRVKTLAELWEGQYITACETMMGETDKAIGVVTGLGAAAGNAAGKFAALASAIYEVIAAYEALNGIDGGTKASNYRDGTPVGQRYDARKGEPPGGGKAAGGPVASGTTYLVGEEGPELFTPSRSGYIIPNDELASGGSDTVINVVFSGDVIGDEKSISSYVKRAVKAGIRQEVLIG